MKSIQFSQESIDNHWGPTSQIQLLKDIPYSPFNKSDRIGKIGDWLAPSDDSNDKREEFKSKRRFGAELPSLSSAFSYQISAEDEADFAMVDHAPTSKKGSLKSSTASALSSKSNSWYKSKDTKSFDPKKKRISNYVTDKKTRETSIKISHEWNLIEELDFIRLNKLYFEVEDPIDLYVFFILLFFYNGK